MLAQMAFSIKINLEMKNSFIADTR